MRFLLAYQSQLSYPFPPHRSPAYAISGADATKKKKRAIIWSLVGQLGKELFIFLGGVFFFEYPLLEVVVDSREEAR